MKNFYLTIFVLVCGFCTKAQTFTDTVGGAIPDNSPGIDFQMQLTGLPAGIDTQAFGLQSVCINVIHSWDSDLDISLVSPDGTIVLLASARGGSGDNFSNTCFDNNADTSIYLVGAPFSGTYKPQGQLGKINDGQNPNGTWILRCRDNFAGDSGTVVTWSVTFGNNPLVPFIFSSSTLPIVVLNTGDITIPNEPFLSGVMQVIDNGTSTLNYLTDVPSFDGNISIKSNFPSSDIFPKKSYILEITDTGGVMVDTSLLGLPADHDWVLISNYHDKSLLRNYLSYYLYQQMGHYSPRMKFCNVVLNNEYIGTYLFGESIKVNQQRVNIAKLDSTCNTPSTISGGYILKEDVLYGIHTEGWYSSFPAMYDTFGLGIYRQYHYPLYDLLTPQQRAYLPSIVDSMEQALAASSFTDTLTGYRKYVDVQSFIDMFLLNEFTKSAEAYRRNAYFYKDVDSIDAHIHAGPPWDYELSWGGSQLLNENNSFGWNFEEQANLTFGEMPFWYQRFMQDPAFVNAFNCTWYGTRLTKLNSDTLINLIDSLAAYLDAAQKQNFAVWPILGFDVWHNATPVPATYSDEIQALKDWVINRINWMDANISNSCFIFTSSQQTAATFGSPAFTVYPNPAEGKITISFRQNKTSAATVTLFDITGKKITVLMDEKIASGNFSRQFNLPFVANGLYLLQLKTGEGISFKKLTIAGK